MWTFIFQRKIRRSLDAAGPRWRASTPPARRAADPLVRQRLAQAHIEVELLRLMRLPQPDPLLRTGHPGAESSLEKVLGSETDQRLQDLAMQPLRPYGGLRTASTRSTTARSRAQFLYARSETIMGGTSEIQRNVIAQRILGLPR